MIAHGQRRNRLLVLDRQHLPYLAVSRLPAVAKATGVRFNWRSFSERAIMREQNNIPFQGKPVKSAYMWRDIERRAGLYGLPIKVPAPYPLKEFDLANRLAVLGLAEGWGIDYIQTSYRRWFVDGQEPGVEPNLSSSLRDAGQDPARSVERAGSHDVGARYDAATEEAKKLGIFGSPTSPWAGNCSGATTGWTTPSRGFDMER